MTGVLSPDQRRKRMAAIRGKNTKPEMVVRSLVHRMGFRRRLYDSRLPGKPDLVFKFRQKIIFVHGCFRHMHNCRYGKVRPKTNADFWDEKRGRDVERDKKSVKMLKKNGWQVLTIWERHTSDLKQLENGLHLFLSR